MSELPPLSTRDVSAQLEKLYRYERKHHLFAFYGTGSDAIVDVPGGGRFAIVPVESELDLREKIQAFESADARAAFLVPWSTEVPLDLMGRFARHGKVLRVGTEARLLRMFGVAELESGLSRSPLARYLLAADPLASFHGTEGRLTEATMWSTWLRERFGMDVRAGVTLDTLLGWAALDGRGAAFKAAMEDPRAEGVRDALLAYFDKAMGPAARGVWAAWEKGQGAVALAFAILCEELATTTAPPAQVWLRLKLKDALGLGDTSERARAALDLKQAAAGAIAYFRRKTDAQAYARLLASADALVDDEGAAGALVHHRRLPSGWRARLDALGRALLESAKEPSPERLAAASEALAQLESHERFLEEKETRRVERALMAVRLSAWLLARTDRQTEGQATPHGDAVALGAWYAAEGGYVDWARAAARDADSDLFGRGVQAVVQAADAVRAELDARFSRGLVAWIEAKRPSGEVLPIDQALARIAVPFLRGDPERRLLVLLMDGMAWAQALELLQSMGERATQWGPLAWHATPEGRVGSAPVPPVFAALPTITEVSRAAFFGGRPIEPGAATSTAKDRERFESHPALRAVCEGNMVPKLLLRADAHTPGGAVTQEALSLVGDVRRRVVGIVVNAIDASLKRDPEQHARWDVESIRPLADLLEAAQQAGRAILLASDHGHVPSDLLERVDAPGADSARWRPWGGSSDVLLEGEVKVSGEGVWAPRGREAVVVLTDDRRRYGAMPNAGEHGGASLAEVVAPCLLIGSATHADPHDAAQRVVGAPVPDWWLLRVRAGRAEVSAPPPRRSGKPKPPDPQLSLLPIAPVALDEPAPAAPPDLSQHPLASSALFHSLAKKKADQERVLRAVEFLVARNGVASTDAFAAAMGELVFRVPGLVSNLQGVLNVDGYQVLWLDSAGKHVHLDTEKLEQQFEVTL